MNRIAGWGLLAALGVGLVGAGALLGVLRDFSDSTRDTAALSALRADATRIALLAEQASRGGDDADLEAMIQQVEQTSALVPEIAVDILGSDEARPHLERIEAGWQHLTTLARLRATGSSNSEELIAAVDTSRQDLDALLGAMAAQTETDTGTVTRLLQVALLLGLAFLAIFALLLTRSLRGYFSEFDAATGLSREGRVRRTIARRLRRDGDAETTLLAIRVDRVDQIRAAFNGETGDRVMMELAARISEVITPAHLIARRSSDEFLVMLEADLSTACEAAAEVIEALDRPFLFGGFQLRATASIGVAGRSGHVAEADAMIQAAGEARALALRGGGARFEVFDPERTPGAAEDTLRLEAELREALDRGEFVLYYQPQISLGSGGLAGAEALLRWQSPARGLVSPAMFVPVLEETDLIDAVGEWVIHAAAREAASWSTLPGMPPRVAVNVSGRQLIDGDLIESVAAALGQSGLEPAMLEVEVTETAAVQSPQVAAQTLSALRALGVQAALDDFGTGHSSLAQIKALPGDSLKIDRAFVTNVATDEADRAIVESVVRIARSLERSTVAEGVETPEQLRLLRELGCDVVQGYLLAKPMPAEEFHAFAQRWSPDSLEALLQGAEPREGGAAKRGPAAKPKAA